MKFLEYYNLQENSRTVWDGMTQFKSNSDPHKNHHHHQELGWEVWWNGVMSLWGACFFSNATHWMTKMVGATGTFLSVAVTWVGFLCIAVALGPGIVIGVADTLKEVDDTVTDCVLPVVGTKLGVSGTWVTGSLGLFPLLWLGLLML